MVEEIVGKRGRVEYAPARRFDVLRIELDTRVAWQQLGWQPKSVPGRWPRSKWISDTI
jgi:nucleoside-diphosphate-sugar epimerase